MKYTLYLKCAIFGMLVALEACSSAKYSVESIKYPIYPGNYKNIFVVANLGGEPSQTDLDNFNDTVKTRLVACGIKLSFYTSNSPPSEKDLQEDIVLFNPDLILYISPEEMTQSYVDKYYIEGIQRENNQIVWKSEIKILKYWDSTVFPIALIDRMNTDKLFSSECSVYTGSISHSP